MDQNILKPDTSQQSQNSNVIDDISPITTYSNRDMNFIALQGFFGIENATSQQQEDMNYIMEHFGNAGARNMSEILLAIRSIENKLGVTPLGVNRITSIKNYLKISNNIVELQKQREAMER